MPEEKIDRLIEEKKIVICAGSGGVGKTTTSAAVGVEAAIRGKRVLVLTIDPARRLANSLGLSEIGNEETPIPAERFEAVGIAPKGELSIMMLDMKRTFDHLIEQFAPNAEVREKIFANDVYQYISGALHGSHEYMAMEKLYEIHARKDYDLLVLDTPPTRHALDFLEAPKRLTDFLEGRVVQWILRPYLAAGRKGFKIFQKGTAKLFGILENVTGVQLLQDVAEFLLSFRDLFDGFKERAEAVDGILRGEETTFLLITSPQRAALAEARFFYKRLVASDMPFGAFIVNRVHPPCANFSEIYMRITDFLTTARENGMPLAHRLPPSISPQCFQTLIEKTLFSFEQSYNLATIDLEMIEELRNFAGREAVVRTVPIFDADVHDIRGLTEINRFIFGEGGESSPSPQVPPAGGSAG